MVAKQLHTKIKKTPRIDAICFDLFHTLVDVAEVPEHVGRYTADILGIEAEVWNGACFSAHHEIRKPSEHIDVIRALAHQLDPEIPMERIQQVVVERQRRFDYALVHVRLSILEAIVSLKQRGLRLALISNASTSEVQAWDRSPLAELFDVALFSCHCGFAKPERQIYELALQQLQLKAQQCLFVGDGGSDEHQGAAAVGMHAVLSRVFVQNRISFASHRAQAPFTQWQVDDYQQIHSILNRMESGHELNS